MMGGSAGAALSLAGFLLLLAPLLYVLGTGFDPATIDPDTFIAFIHCWGVLAVLSAVGLIMVKEMMISSRSEHSKLPNLGSIDKKIGWMVMETPILVSVLYYYAAAGAPGGAQGVMVGAFALHYTHRALIYPHRIRVEGKTMPVFTMLSAMGFYAINGFLVGHYFGAIANYPQGWLRDPRFYAGCVLFATGFAINVASDHTLINLRRPGETGYKVPRGGLFEYVTCANYLGECIEWAGFAVMSWCSVGLVYAVWVILPLIAQGRTVHQWYLQKFEDYPKNRTAIIPCLL